MLDTIIVQVNELGNNQPEQLTFTDRHGNIIGDHDNIDESPGVDSMMMTMEFQECHPLHLMSRTPL